MKTLEFPEGFDYVKRDMERYGVWENRTTEYVQSHLKPGQVFLDVGAQVGYYSTLAASLGAKVYAFEPSPMNREYLLRNVQGMRVMVFDYALSNSAREANLFKGKTSGEHSLLGTGESVSVRALPFDDLGIPDPDMIKLDIEGHEKQALQGMERVLQTHRPLTIILEDWYNKTTDWLVDTYGFKLVTTDRAYGNRILVKNQDVVPVKEPLRIHLLGPFNAPVTLEDEGLGNAFASKCVRMVQVLKKLGHHVILYGVEGSKTNADEFVQVSTKAILEECYGKWDKTKVYGEGEDNLAHKTFNENAIREINSRKLFGDFLLCSFGVYQKPIADAVDIKDTVEIGIGYTGSFARFRIFESHAHMNWTYGAERKGDGNFYDTVIPGFFDPRDFTYSGDKDDYFLFIGRIISGKGILIAKDVCKRLGKKLIVAGFGHGDEVFREVTQDPCVEYVGFAGKEKRRELLSRAKAVFMPTTYLEPFGYVALEAAFSGTPVITTDFGAFPETVVHGRTGYRCRNFKEFLEAVRNIDSINPASCLMWAMNNFTIDAVAPQYQQYFDQILSLYGKGWYAE